MWIRIQDKEALVYANNFYIRATEVEEKYGISYFDGDSFVKLGFYKSKERAIEVLDEIQEGMIKNAVAKVVDAEKQYIIPNPVIIYEMPKE